MFYVKAGGWRAPHPKALSSRTESAELSRVRETAPQIFRIKPGATISNCGLSSDTPLDIQHPTHMIHYPQSAKRESHPGRLRMVTIHSSFVILISSFLFGCASYLANSNTQAALSSVLSGAVAYASGNDVAAAVDGIQGASYFVRSLQSTPNAANPNAVAAAVATGGAVPIAATVANAIVTLTKAGVKPDDANEQVAEQLDAAAAQAIVPGAASATQASRSKLPASLRPDLDWTPSLDRGIEPSLFQIQPFPEPRGPLPLIRIIDSYNPIAVLA